MKIKDLFEYEDIQDVIEIGKIQNEKELIEKFVISPDLEKELIDFLDILGEKKHKSVNIIGNYGTGKSHLLAFISLVFSKPDLIDYIQSVKIKDKLKKFKREFIVVKYELPATQAKSLASIFFYRVKKQLKENYDIDIREIDVDDENKDTKELVDEILNKVKEKNPTAGLMVIFDEFSDFLKQKQAIDRNYDLQFYRQLGECSNSMDFMFIASMQEHIFSNPKYVDQAESIARTKQRYKDLRITNESIKEIVSKRVVSKSSNQIEDIKKEFNEIEHYFSNLAIDQDEYVRLFPVHPYVIDVFSILPYFEKRGIIQFISREIKPLMEKDFPQFITYDLIYDNIDRVLAIKNHPDVRPVVDAVDTLKNKIDLLDSKIRDIALKLVKACAILCLVKSSEKNGATAQELANTLFIIPSNKILSPVDDIERILGNLIRVSDGQFIEKSKDGVYYLNLKKTTDYDVKIQNRVSNLNDLKYVNEKFVESFLLDQLGIFVDASKISYFDTSKKYVLDDSAFWEDRKSFRSGHLVLDIGYDVSVDSGGEYVLSIPGYGVKDAKSFDSNHIVVKLDYDSSFVKSIKTLAAIEDFIRTKTYVPIMQAKKRNVIDNELRSAFTKALKNSVIEYNNKKYKVLDDLGINSDVSEEIFKQIKQKLLNEEFTKIYPDYPKFRSMLSAENIKGTVESILKDISQKQGIAENLLNQSVNILAPLGLYKDNRLDVTDSKYVKIILEKLDDSSKNVSISDILELFSKKPYGLQKEIVFLIIAVLLRNGDIILSSRRGNVYSASDFSSVFASGLKSFDDISYMKKEEDLKVSEVQLLFDAIDEDISLLNTRKDRPEAFRKYIDKVERIEKDIVNLGQDFERLKQSSNVGFPIEEIHDKIDEIEKVDFSKLKIKSLVEFKKLDYSSNRIKEIKDGFESIKILKKFFAEYFEYIQAGISYMKNVTDQLDEKYFSKNDIDRLNQIFSDSKEIISNFRKLIKDDERKPLKGKIDDFKRKYKEIYYHTHNKYVGKDVDWKTLSEVENSDDLKRLHILKNIKCVNQTKLTDILLNIENLKAIKCTEFNVDELDNNFICPHCMFPNGNYDINIKSTISEIETKFSSIIKTWESDIFEEVNNNKDKISNLSQDEKTIIQSIISKGFLPKEIDQKTISAINSLLEDLEIKEIDLKNLYKILTKDSDVLKIDDFKAKIESYLDDMIKAENEKNVRLKIKNIKDE
jgi:hypothetical protein